MAFSLEKSNFGDPSFRHPERTRSRQESVISLLLLSSSPFPPTAATWMVLSTQVTFLNSSFFWLNKIIIFSREGGEERTRVRGTGGAPYQDLHPAVALCNTSKTDAAPPLHPRTDGRTDGRSDVVPDFAVTVVVQ